MPAAVAASVTTTVRMTPTRSASAPQANLPAAPPAKTSISASPTARTVEPLAMRRNGNNVRKAERVDYDGVRAVKNEVFELLYACFRRDRTRRRRFAG